MAWLEHRALGCVNSFDRVYECTYESHTTLLGASCAWIRGRFGACDGLHWFSSGSHTTLLGTSCARMRARDRVRGHTSGSHAALLGTAEGIRETAVSRRDVPTLAKNRPLE